MAAIVDVTIGFFVSVDEQIISLVEVLRPLCYVVCRVLYIFYNMTEYAAPLSIFRNELALCNISK